MDKLVDEFTKDRPREMFLASQDCRSNQHFEMTSQGDIPCHA